MKLHAERVVVPMNVAFGLAVPLTESFPSDWNKSASDCDSGDGRRLIDRYGRLTEDELHHIHRGVLCVKDSGFMPHMRQHRFF